jgi:hypothetical protein
MEMAEYEHMRIFKLSAAELAVGVAIAAWRLTNVLTKEWGPGHGERHNKGLDQRDVTGALGELAFAKFKNVYWNPTEDEFGKRGDVAGFEVRAINYDRGHMPVFEGDADERPVALVVVRFPTCRIAGWRLARDCKLAKYYIDGSDPRLRRGSPSQYWVPQDALMDVPL